MIGREKEEKTLNALYNSGSAELVAIYGRRRIGKTYLVDETFGDRITFHHAGLSPIEEGGNSMKKQLEHFYYSLVMHGMKAQAKPKDWLEAFFMLEMLLKEKDDGSRQLVFLDELPWMDTKRSGFISAFEGFWNTYACHRHNLMVIVCGSANSWILDKLINNHGGLYGRVTYEIELFPFTLGETKSYFNERGIILSDYDIAQSYMIFGGVPYYLKYFEKGLSLAENVDNILFKKGAVLRNEFDRLFASVFSNPDTMMHLVQTIGKKRIGLTREEISKESKISSGSNLTGYLNALITSGFATKYQPFQSGKRDMKYKLIDPFCLFYLKFVYDRNISDEQFYEHNLDSPAVVSWRGLAFENVCFQHIREIKNALGISGVATRESSWSIKNDNEESDGTQIDMVIDRNDNIVDMCEIKYSSEDFVVTKSYDRVLRNRAALLRDKISRKKALHSILITTFGLKYNEYSGDFVKVITLEELFQ